MQDFRENTTHVNKITFERQDSEKGLNAIHYPEKTARLVSSPATKLGSLAERRKVATGSFLVRSK